MPARDWLFSSGVEDSYCKTEGHSLLCCPGHTRDLVATYRELLQHSMCRPCLQVFWRWANESGRVDWWTWSYTKGTTSPQEEVEDNEVSLDSPSCTTCSSVDDSIGVCQRCNDQLHPKSVKANNDHATNLSGNQNTSISENKVTSPTQPASKVARLESNAATTEILGRLTEIQTRQQMSLPVESSRGAVTDTASLGRGIKRKFDVCETRSFSVVSYLPRVA
uniref:WD_REPEATS_REGION domain-containing protein n=1 Tax=Mesocestoides corti TaxID=53468 RepID=A0A5K3EY79_MESCO